MVAATREREDVGLHNNEPQHNGSLATEARPHNEAAIEQTGKQEIQTPEGVERTRPGRIYTPAVDIYETSDAIVLLADMPGVNENSVDVTFEKNVLTIYGRVEPHVPEGYTPVYREYGIGDYQRSFAIREQIDWEHVTGTVKNGVLTLTLPKAEIAKTRKITIKSQ